MPTYDYLCNACGHRFEKFQSITSEPVHVCPKCSKENVTRLMSGGMGLIFKGSGFYITDYKNNNILKRYPHPPRVGALFNSSLIFGIYSSSYSCGSGSAA